MLLSDEYQLYSPEPPNAWRRYWNTTDGSYGMIYPQPEPQRERERDEMRDEMRDER
jgi:hypothetical protein